MGPTTRKPKQKKDPDPTKYLTEILSAQGAVNRNAPPELSAGLPPEFVGPPDPLAAMMAGGAPPPSMPTLTPMPMGMGNQMPGGGMMGTIPGMLGGQPQPQKPTAPGVPPANPADLEIVNLIKEIAERVKPAVEDHLIPRQLKNIINGHAPKSPSREHELKRLLMDELFG